MILGIVNINSCVTFKFPTIKNKLPCDNGISCRLICLQGVVSLIFYLLFTVTSNNNTMNIKNRIGNRNYHFKLLIIVFQITLNSILESEEFRETSIVKYITFMFPISN